MAGVDRLRQLQNAVFDVQFGGKADQSHRPGWRDRLCQQALHRVGEELADFRIAVGGNRADLGDLVVGGDLLGVLLQVRNHRFNR